MVSNAQSADEILRLAYDSTNVALKVNITVLDNKRLKIGTDGDVSLVLNSAGLAANTALANVLIGTPVTPAIAADSLIIANATANGDILIAGNDGGHSRVAMFFDASAPNTILYNVGGTWSAGATTWTIPAVTLGGAMTLNGQVFNAGTGVATITSTGTGGKGLTLRTTNTTSSGVRLLVDHVNTSAAANDVLIDFYVSGLDDAQAAQDYVSIQYMIESAAAASPAGRMEWWMMNTTFNLAMKLSAAGALWSDLSVDTLTYKVSGTQVVGARVVDARADDVVDSTYGAEEAGVLDALRDAMITHGLIAAA